MNVRQPRGLTENPENLEEFLKRSAPAPRKTPPVVTHRHRGGSDRRRTRSVVVLSLTVAGLWWACGNPTGPSTPLLVTAPPGAITVGGQVKLTAFIISNGVRQDVSSQAAWSSTPTGIVSIDSTGLATGLAVGTATVTASFNGQHALVGVNVVALTFLVVGLVTDAVSVPVPGALVSATSGAATLTTYSDPSGHYGFTVPAGSWQVQASADGFTSASQTITLSGNTTLNFALTPTATPTGLGGDWQIVLSAPPDCASTLPADARQFTFTGAIGVTLSQLVLTMRNLQGPSGGPFSVDGQMFGNAVTFALPEFDYYGAVSGELVLQLAPTRWIGIFGTITGTLTGTTIPAVLTGEFNDFETANAQTLPTDPPTASCTGVGTVAFTRIVPSAAHRIRR
jgi:hypothetical protein